MAREKENFRAQLEVINEHFNCKPVLGLMEVSKWMGISHNTANKRYSFEHGRISAVQLASEMLPSRR